MKKTIPILLFGFTLFSCSTSNKCIQIYLKDELNNNRSNNITSLLVDKKKETKLVLTAYSYKDLKTNEYKVKNYNQIYYDELKNKISNDTMIENWKKREAEKFNFESIFTNKYLDFSNKENVKLEIYKYSISKPIFIKNKKIALFGLSIIKKTNNIYDSYLVIMEKENGNWIIKEKVQSLMLY